VRRPLINLALLLAVSFSFGGLGQRLHEWHADAGRAANHDHDRGGGGGGGHGDHDHDGCAVCQTLATPRVERLPGGGMICVAAVVDPPAHAPPADERAPQRLFVHTPAAARAPPAAPRA